MRDSNFHLEDFMAKPIDKPGQIREYERFIGRMLRAEMKQARWYGITLSIISLLVGLVVGLFYGAADATSAFFVAFVLGVDLYLLSFSINNVINGGAVDRAIAYIKQHQFSPQVLEKLNARGEIMQVTIGLGILGTSLILAQLVSDVSSQISMDVLESRPFWTLVTFMLFAAFMVLFVIAIGVLVGSIRHAIVECTEEEESMPGAQGNHPLVENPMRVEALDQIAPQTTASPNGNRKNT